MDRHRFWDWLCRCFGLRAAPSFEAGPLVLPTWADWADEPVAPSVSRTPTRSRPLAGQLAATARLNVPTGRKARTMARPVARSQKPKPIHKAVVAKRSMVVAGNPIMSRPFMSRPMTTRLVTPLAPMPSAPIIRLPQPTPAVRPTRTAIAA